ncbi:MAG: glycosyltransferase family 4 protein [Aulosira sp. ZfuVER01]|nr:glycosyltransferase family 4 protein [Aulosira sp. ZfuVER01]MDZ8001990.1 glycosyltransferase family 4 protein [Aulosira sp. DedVER01a]MDZ8054932.1 glycosyltransferase family 4 protein [Aulosira sp. ZfuCHP01]
MKLKKIVVTGDGLFLRRYRPLFETLSLQCEQLEYLSGDEPFRLPVLNKAAKLLNKLIYLISPVLAGKRQKNKQAFIKKSKRLERSIEQLDYKPDFVLHIFGMYCPFWEKFDIPYGMYLDYTMSLVKHNWLPWAPFSNYQEFTAWLECERLAYQRAYHLFTMSHVVKSSLITDYGIEPEKITVVGSFANRHTVYEGEKPFGSKQILFNGAEFERKGGDIVLAAFKQVKTVLPESKLVIIGKQLGIQQEGVENPGQISSLEEMRHLFLQTDLVVAPGKCDPFPSFLIEAMNYGVPCIVSPNDGMPEIVDPGISGIVVDPLTPELLAEKIIHLLNDISTLTAMSQAGRQKVKTQLNCEKVAASIKQVLLNS